MNKEKNQFKVLLNNTFDIQESFKQEYNSFRKEFIYNLFKKTLNNKTELIITSFTYLRYNDLTWDYYFSFYNSNINETSLNSLFEKKVTILKKAIQKEIDLLEIKLNNFEEYIQYLIKEKTQNKYFLTHNISVINSFWEDITNNEIDRNYIEYALKYIYNYITQNNKYKLENLQYHDIFLHKLSENFDNWYYNIIQKDKNINNEELIRKDFFINVTDILSYKKEIFTDLLAVKSFFDNTYKENFFKEYLSDDWIKLLAPIVTTLSNMKQTLEHGEQNKYYDQDPLNGLKKDIEKLENNNIYIIENQQYVSLKDNINLEELTNSFLSLFFDTYNFNSKEKKIIKMLSINTNIQFSNYIN